MLRIQPRRSLRRLPVKAQPLLDADIRQLWSAFGQIEEKNKIERNRSSQNRIAAEKIHLDLHRITQPAEDIDVIPALFVIPTRRIIVDPHLVIEILV